MVPKHKGGENVLPPCLGSTAAYSLSSPLLLGQVSGQCYLAGRSQRWVGRWAGGQPLLFWATELLSQPGQLVHEGATLPSPCYHRSGVPSWVGMPGHSAPSRYPSPPPPCTHWKPQILKMALMLKAGLRTVQPMLSHLAMHLVLALHL